MTPSGMPQVVWFKRDLRVEDHTALARATAAGPVLSVYAVELDHWHQPCTGDRQWQFVRECLLSLDVQLKSLGTALEVHVAPVIQMLDALYLRLGPVPDGVTRDVAARVPVPRQRREGRAVAADAAGRPRLLAEHDDGLGRRGQR